MWFLLNQIGVCITSLRPGPVTMDYKVWSKPRQVHNAAIVVWGVLCTRCAKVASNYVKISSSPLNPLSKVINCSRVNTSPKEPNELWLLCKLFSKGKVVGIVSFPFSSVSRGGRRTGGIQGMGLNVALCTRGGLSIQSGPDGKSRQCFHPSNVWKILPFPFYFISPPIWVLWNGDF